MYELRASAFGSCIKAQAARLQGFEPMLPPEQMQAAFDRGNVHEDECAAAMRANHYVIEDEQLELALTLGSGGTITGHLDGIVWDDPTKLGTERVWEAKAPNAWAKFESAYKRNDWSDPLCHRYAWQISIYMHATGLEAMVCCLDDGQIKSFVIEVPPFTIAAIEARVGQIIGWADSGTLPAECSQNDYPCPFVYLHEAADLDEDEAIDVLVAQWVQADIDEKHAKAAKNEIAEMVKRAMGDRTEITTASSKVSIYEQKGPSKWDEALMMADGISAEKYRRPGQPSTRIKITPQGEKNAD